MIRKVLIKRNYYSLVFIFLIALFLSCASKEESIFTDPQNYYNKGISAFEKKKWDRAIDHFRMVILNSPGGELADDSQFYLGECYFNKKEYLIAISEYHQLTERYSFSSFVEDAYFKIALSYCKLSPKYQLDQSNSIKALQQLQDFVDAFPASKHYEEAEKKIQEFRNKLARKVYESGCLYIKLEEWESAIIYFDNLLETYYDTPWSLKSKLGKAQCLIRLRDFDTYHQLLAEIKEEENSEEIMKGINKLDKIYEKEIKKINREQRKRRT